MRTTRTTVGGGLGLILILVLWVAASRDRPDIVLPSPTATWLALLDMAADGTLVAELARTLWRAVTGVVAGVVLGGVWGAVCGASRWAQAISQPLISALLAIPPVIYVAIGLIWFGPGDGVSRMVIILVTLPFTVVTVAEAVQNVDSELLEMARVFQVSRLRRYVHIVLPSITSPIMAVLTVTFGGAVRVTVMAELLAASNGIGAEVSRARVNLETADLFAWTIVLVIVVILLETLILDPITNHALRWRNDVTRTTVDGPAASPGPAGRPRAGVGRRSSRERQP